MAASNLAITINVRGKQAEAALNLLERKLGQASTAAVAASAKTKTAAEGSSKALTESAKLAGKFERALAAAEKRASTFGLKGAEKIKAQRDELLKLARTGDDAEKVSRVFKPMIREAERAATATSSVQRKLEELKRTASTFGLSGVDKIEADRGQFLRSVGFDKLNSKTLNEANAAFDLMRQRAQALEPAFGAVDKRIESLQQRASTFGLSGVDKLDAERREFLRGLNFEDISSAKLNEVNDAFRVMRERTVALDSPVKRLETGIAALERQSATFGLKGSDKLRAQRDDFIKLNQAAGATPAQLDRISKSYDTMIARSDAATTKTTALAERFGQLRNVAASVATGILVARGAEGVFNFLDDVFEQRKRLEQLEAATPVVAQNVGVSTRAVEALNNQIRELDVSLLQANQTTATFLQAGLPLKGGQELIKVARNLAVVMGGTVPEAAERLVGAIVKEEVEILETAGLLIKFQRGYEDYARVLGKNAKDLSELEKLQARYNQVLEQGQRLAGAYESTQDGLGVATSRLGVAFSDLTGEISRFAGGADSVNVVTRALGFLEQKLKDVRTDAAFAREVLKDIRDVDQPGGGLLGLAAADTAPALGRAIQRRALEDERAIRKPFAPVISETGVSTPTAFSGLEAETAEKARIASERLKKEAAESAKRAAAAAKKDLEDLQRLSEKVFSEADQVAKRQESLFARARADLLKSPDRTFESTVGKIDTQALEKAQRRNEAFLGAQRELQTERLGFALEALQAQETAELDSLALVTTRTLEEKINLESRKAEIEARFRAARTTEEIKAIRLQTQIAIAENPALAGVLSARQSNQTKAALDRGEAEVTSINARAAARASDLAIAEQERIFDNLRQQADGVFDALFLRTRSLGDFFKTTLLTALKSVSSNFTASVLAPLFGGAAGGRSSGGLGGLLGLGAGIGSISRPGAPGGTPGFAGPVAGLGGGARLGGLLGGGGAGAAATGASLAGLLATGGLLAGGGVLSARLGGGNPFARGAVGAGAGAGIGIGTVGILGQLAPGLLATGPLGAAIIGGGIAAGALLNALLPKAQGRLKKEVLSAYGVRIEDQGVLKTLLGIAKSSGGVAAGIRTPAARELIEAFALATGQEIGSGIVARTTPALFTQRGGTLFAEPTFFAGRAVAPQSSLPTFNISAPQQSGRRLDPSETRFVLMEALGAVTSPERVAASSLEADKRSIGRSARYALGAEPTTVLR